MRRSLRLLVVFALAACGHPHETQPSRHTSVSTSIQTDSAVLVGMYSDVTYNEGSGDVNGTEIGVRRNGSHLVATFQRAEGEPGVRRTIPAQVDGRTIRFTIPPDTGIDHHGDGSESPIQLQPARVFVGTISKWGLTGHVEGEADSVKLPRRSRPAVARSTPRIDD